MKSSRVVMQMARPACETRLRVSGMGYHDTYEGTGGRRTHSCGGGGKHIVDGLVPEVGYIVLRVHEAHGEAHANDDGRGHQGGAQQDQLGPMPFGIIRPLRPKWVGIEGIVAEAVG
jgi:hypothetical protein